MMIHLLDQDTKETFQSFGDNEVQAAIAAARVSGKIVNMELDEECKDCLIYIVRPELSTTQADTMRKYIDIYKAAVTATENLLRSFTETMEEIHQLRETRPPSEIKKEIRHTKNPMRLSQLHKELNASYKAYGRKHK